MKIYSGETIEGVMVFTGDDGQPIKDFSQIEIKLLIRNRHDDYSILVKKNEMTITEEKVSFTISADKTKDLKLSVIMELKLIEGGKVKIAKCESIEVVDNWIKNL